MSKVISRPYTAGGREEHDRIFSRRGTEERRQKLERTPAAKEKEFAEAMEVAELVLATADEYTPKALLDAATKLISRKAGR